MKTFNPQVSLLEKEAIGSEVRRCRRYAGWTVEQAAEKAGISSRQWQKYEAGELNEKGLQRVIRLFNTTEDGVFYPTEWIKVLEDRKATDDVTIASLSKSCTYYIQKAEKYEKYIDELEARVRELTIAYGGK